MRNLFAAALIMGAGIVGAHAADYTCTGLGKCVCDVPRIAPKALGYDAKDGKMTLTVVCINHATWAVRFWDRPQDEVIAWLKKQRGDDHPVVINSAVPVPHKGGDDIGSLDEMQ